MLPLSGLPVRFTARRKVLLAIAGELQVEPLSVERTKLSAPPLILKSLNATYWLPKNGLDGLLSTHAFRASRLFDDSGHTAGVQVIPSGEVHRPIPPPPQAAERKVTDQAAAWVL